MMNQTEQNAVSRPWLEREIAFCQSKVDALIPRFYDCFPGANTERLVYPADTENYEWTPAFYSGMLWLLYLHTREDRYLRALDGLLPSFYERVEKPGYVDTHDLGFLYDLSCYPAMLLGLDPRARNCFLKAADYLKARYFKKAGIIQAWGNLRDPENRGRMIIDCLMNLPLLYQASRITGDPIYRCAAYSHALQAQKYLVRPDFSTYHTYYMDVETGEPRFGRTAQGYSDTSCWARGQAWAVYGFTLSYAHTGDERFLQTACHVLDYFLEHLPEDHVCYWDLFFTEGDQPRDSSAAAITCCGIHELLRHLPASHSRRAVYEQALKDMMTALSERYTAKALPQADGILLHGVYSIPHTRGVDECTIWGDYYYLEALCRLYTGECSFWT